MRSMITYYSLTVRARIDTKLIKDSYCTAVRVLSLLLPHIDHTTVDYV